MKLRRVVKPMRLFPAKGPVELMSIDILGKLIKTPRPRENKSLLEITDSYSKLLRTIHMKRISTLLVAQAFVHHWLFVYGPPQDLLSDNGIQFNERLFVDICRILGIKNQFTTTYHPQINGQVERFNRKILSALRRYVADHPTDWNLFTKALAYAYNTQPRTTTRLIPFELVLSRPPPALTVEYEPKLELVVSQRTYYEKLSTWLTALMSTALTKVDQARTRYKRDFDALVRKKKKALRPEEYAIVRKEHFSKEAPKNKLAPIADGPYRIVSVQEDTAFLDSKG